MAGKRTLLAQRRRSCGYAQEKFAEAMGVDRSTVQRWERGTADPQPHQRPKMARVLQVDPEELEELLTPEDPVLPTMGDARDEGFTLTVRETTQRLIELDNQVHGLPISDVAAQAFKRVHHKLGSGEYDRKFEREIRAAASELAEVAGWALFNEGKFGPARRFNQEALFLAKLAGDRSVELITLQNMGMLAGWSGRAREELAIARSVLDQGNLSPRIEAMFRAREGQGLAGSGQASDAARSFDRARSLLLDSAPGDEPSWAWWVSNQEIDRQQGRVFHEIGDWHSSIPILERAMQHQEGSYVGYQNVAAVRLLDSLLRVKSWRSAEEEAEKLLPAVGEMSSVVTLKILERVAERGKRLTGAPRSLRDALDCMQAATEEDPYEI